MLSRRAARIRIKRVRVFFIAAFLLIFAGAVTWSSVASSQAVGGPPLVVSVAPNGVALNEPLAVQPTIALTAGDTQTLSLIHI